jgi:hypothetical protein
MQDEDTLNNAAHEYASSTTNGNCMRIAFIAAEQGFKSGWRACEAASAPPPINPQAQQALDQAAEWVTSVTNSLAKQDKADTTAGAMLTKAVDMLERLPSNMGMPELEAEIEKFLEEYWER